MLIREVDFIFNSQGLSFVNNILIFHFRKMVILTMNKDTLNTLFVGIDVSSKSNYVVAINFNGDSLLDFSVPNDLPGAELMLDRILSVLQDNNLSFVTIVIESTSVYSFHIANFLFKILVQLNIQM